MIGEEGGPSEDCQGPGSGGISRFSPRPAFPSDILHTLGRIGDTNDASSPVQARMGHMEGPMPRTPLPSQQGKWRSEQHTRMPTKLSSKDPLGHRDCHCNSSFSALSFRLWPQFAARLWRVYSQRRERSGQQACRRTIQSAPRVMPFRERRSLPQGGNSSCVAPSET